MYVAIERQKNGKKQTTMSPVVATHDSYNVSPVFSRYRNTTGSRTLPFERERRDEHFDVHFMNL